MTLLVLSVVVFSLTLLVTKSKIFACKRKFVDDMYNASKVNNQDPGWVHRIWHAYWTCPMCAGFWNAIAVCLLFGTDSLIVGVFFCFGINWLLQCLEEILFYGGEFLKNSVDSEKE